MQQYKGQGHTDAESSDLHPEKQTVSSAAGMNEKRHVLLLVFLMYREKELEPTRGPFAGNEIYYQLFILRIPLFSEAMQS